MRTKFLILAILVTLAMSAGGCTSGLLTGGPGTTVTTGAVAPGSGGGGTTAPLTTGAGTGITPADGISAVPSGAQCSYRRQDGYTLPDPVCTPGVTNPNVTEADIRSTICVRGWTSTVRPPESYAGPLKRDQMARYGDTGSMSGYEEDHLIPLELGGSPADPRNLWPQPGSSPNPKDDVEYAANRAVCSGEMPLAEAQREIAADWVSLGRSLGVLEGTN